MNKKYSIKTYFKQAYFSALILFILFFLIFVIFFNNQINNNLKKIFYNTAIKKYRAVVETANREILDLLQLEQSNYIKGIEMYLHDRIYSSYNLANNILTVYKNNLPANEIKKKIIKTFLNYNKVQNFYPFILSEKGDIILFTPNPFFEGKNIEELKKENIHLFYYLTEVIQYREIFYIGKFFPQDKRVSSKTITYIKDFEPFNWKIGIIAFYEEELKEYLLNKVLNINVNKIANFIILDLNNHLLAKSKNASIKEAKNITNLKVVSNFPGNNWKIITYISKSEIYNNVNKIWEQFIKVFTNIITASIILSIFFFLIFSFGFKIVSRKVLADIQIFSNFFSKVGLNYSIKIDKDLINCIEFVDLAYLINQMRDTIKDNADKLNNALINLNNEKQYLNIIFENLGAGIIVLNSNGKIEFINREATSILKYNLNDIKGKTFFDAFKPKNKFGNKISENECIFLHFNLLKERFSKEHIILKDKKNNDIHISLNAVPLHKGDKIEKVIISFNNISTLIAQREEILKLKIAIEQSPITIMITDKDSNIEYVNPFFNELTGYSNEEVLGKKPKILATEHNYSLYPYLWETILSGKTWEGEFLNKKKNGELYWEKALISPIYNSNGDLINYIAVKDDITELKKVHKELIKAKDEAEKANKLKSEFLANMSHEIRTPMNAILGFIDLLLDTELDKTQKEYIELVKSSSNKLLKILNDILDLSKLEAGKLEYDNKPFNLRTLLENDIFIFEKNAKTKGLNFNYKISEDIPEYLIGDEVRILQVVRNLINNAIKFTQKGEVGIEVNLIYKNDEKCKIKFKIYDTGIGIPEDKVKSIFSAFTQADASVTRKFGGTGLGLTISQKIVKAYNGDIWVESQDGKGSKFYFTIELPIAKNVDISKEFKDEKYNILFKDAKVLVAEDNKTNQILIRKILENLNISSVIVNNGLEAIKELAKNDYNLILMDWHMEEMDGLEATEILRKIEKGEEINNPKISQDIILALKNKKFIIIALSAAAMLHEKNILLQSGFDEYLSKPIDKDKLIQLLAKYLKYDLVDKKDKQPQKKEEINKSPNLLNSELYFNINELKKIVGDDDEELIMELFDAFKVEFDKYIEQIENSLKEKNFQNVYIAAHSLKGSAGNIKLTELYNIAKKLEQAAKKENITEIEKYFDYIKNVKFKIIQN